MRAPSPHQRKDESDRASQNDEGSKHLEVYPCNADVDTDCSVQLNSLPVAQVSKDHVIVKRSSDIRACGPGVKRQMLWEGGNGSPARCRQPVSQVCAPVLTLGRQSRTPLI